ncbi:hypothetical protein BACCAP_00449 [Pseudoflavonifractor capillosus ATCC 29799]|uniref:Uncharacterized protein n=1 Tax=Pseudoflavonifractor capillosus ATCC 29799 TaxID=411467 RepID=A6NQI0_9FIRM|nr:hypothetical protein BACCAP_00449 [Pseudoflavonifractor capillosus ATCC 29799]
MVFSVFFIIKLKLLLFVICRWKGGRKNKNRPERMLRADENSVVPPEFGA